MARKKKEDTGPGRLLLNITGQDNLSRTRGLLYIFALIAHRIAHSASVYVQENAHAHKKANRGSHDTVNGIIIGYCSSGREIGRSSKFKVKS